MRLSAVVLVSLSLVFAGCSSPDEDTVPDPEISDGKDDPAPTPPAQQPSPPPAPPAAPDNQAPVAALTASAESGDIPLQVDFTLDASDPEGDALVWAFDADGDGENEAEGEHTDLPATVTHTYAAAGVYDAVLLVSDGHLQGDAILMLNVSAAMPDGLLLSGVVAEPCENCSRSLEDLIALGPLLCRSFVTHEAGDDCIWFDVTADMLEKGFTASSTGGNPDMVFANTCSFPADMGGPEPEPYLMPDVAEFYWEDGPEAGIVPADAGCVILWEKDAAGPHTITLQVG